MRNKYISAPCIAIILLLSTTFNTYAGFIPDPTPCDPDDAQCPLDTWVIPLFVLTLVVTTWFLYRKQKSHSQTDSKTLFKIDA